MTLDGALQRAMWIARGLGFTFLVYFLTVFPGLIVPGAGVIDAMTGGSRGPWLAVGVSAVTFALATLFVILYSRTGPDADRPWKLLRVDRWWRAEWGRGLVIGAGLATLAVAPIVMRSETHILGFAPDAFSRPWDFLGVGLILVIEAAREELGFRGPAQRELSRAVSFPGAAVFLAASFALVHAGNPAVGGTGLLGIFLAGVGLAGLVRARGDLGMACGVHAGWNLALGMVWSMPVSGLHLEPVLLDTSSNWSIWTGGSFGVEGSAPALVVLALFTLVTWWLPEARCGVDDRRRGAAAERDA